MSELHASKVATLTDLDTYFGKTVGFSLDEGKTWRYGSLGDIRKIRDNEDGVTFEPVHPVCSQTRTPVQVPRVVEDIPLTEIVGPNSRIVQLSVNDLRARNYLI